MPPPSISIVVPVYNSAEILPALVARIDAVLRPQYPELELILVNDASRDGSFEEIKKAAAAHAWIRGIDLLRNFGQHNALLCGIRAARNSVIVTMDDDLQHPPEEVPKLVLALDGPSGERVFDVVYGTPSAEQHGLWRDTASIATKFAMRAAMGVPGARSVSAFRAFRAELRRGFDHFDGPHASVDVLLSWATTRFGAVSVPHAPRASGRSNYTFRALVRHAITMLTGFSLLPLRLATVLGFVFMLFGLGVFAYVLYGFLEHGSVVHGFAFLASSIAIFSGVQLFALGMIGEYVGRIHFHTMGRPTYAVREDTSETRRR